MRRFIFVFILLLSIFTLYGEETSKAMTQIVPVFFAGNDTAFEFGFSSNIITRVTDEPIILGDTLSFNLNSNGASSTDVFYLWWKVYSSSQYVITITGTPLNDNSNEFINWKNKEQINGKAFSTSVTNNAIATINVQTASNKPIAGSQKFQLNIFEADLEKDLISDSFSGNITVNVMVQ